MHSDPNSDYKQCTESKLGWVYSAHAQGPRLGACWAPCRGALGAESWLHSALSQAVSRAVSQAPATTQNCIAIQRSMTRVLHDMSRVCRSVPAPYHRALPCCIAALLRRIATPKVTPLSQYKNCIVTH